MTKDLPKRHLISIQAAINAAADECFSPSYEAAYDAYWRAVTDGSPEKTTSGQKELADAVGEAVAEIARDAIQSSFKTLEGKFKDQSGTTAQPTKTLQNHINDICLQFEISFDPEYPVTDDNITFMNFARYEARIRHRVWSFVEDIIHHCDTKGKAARVFEGITIDIISSETNGLYRIARKGKTDFDKGELYKMIRKSMYNYERELRDTI